jgi:hypothetical protein
MARKLTYIATPSSGTVTAITASSTTLTTADTSNRTYGLVINKGSGDVWLGLGAAAVVGKGILLGASRGWYEMSGQQGNLYDGAITAIADTTASEISYQLGSGE